MPELPEVEVTRLGFADAIAGATIHAVALGKPLRWPLGVAPEALVGQGVLAVPGVTLCFGGLAALLAFAGH